MKPFGIILTVLAIMFVGVFSYTHHKETTNPSKNPASIPIPVPKPLSGCGIIGDDVAIGLGWKLGGCWVSAKLKMNSSEVFNRINSANIIVISIGNYDTDDSLLLTNLKEIRTKIVNNRTKRIIWILPSKMSSRIVIQNFIIGIKFDGVADRVVDVPGRYGIHPDDYNKLAKTVLKEMQ